METRTEAARSQAEDREEEAIVNVETREALLFSQRQMENRRGQLLKRREVLQDEIDELNAEMTELERRLTAICEDLRA